ncbi:unnamed protein product [Sordaria macrospora k-hell]|uniref:WGS project CABT00000000 data, contig 2.12 n=1 Tax=Sordaria macrospora (strain ATCC MYA-333 / DSM 997 / K(L3346) / K-hell) TaxID=771870 RepID=F7VXK0_SORMK|nr:uncharacterized protein SMAC_02820 [Sordaria macrospora k-hell]CCC10243.1 unnamed protein product [Sordaria macrospora k-hell]
MLLRPYNLRATTVNLTTARVPVSQSHPIGGLIYSRQQYARPASAPFAKRSLVTLSAGTRLAKLTQEHSAASIAAVRMLSTTSSLSKVKQVPKLSQSAHQKSPKASQSQNHPSSSSSSSSFASASKFTAPQKPPKHQQRLATETAPLHAQGQHASPDLDRVTKEFLAKEGIPTEHMTLTALRALVQPTVPLAASVSASHDSHSPAVGAEVDQTSAFDLLGLDANGRNARGTTAAPEGLEPPPYLSFSKDAADEISDAAYAIISHPPVIITPLLLKEYGCPKLSSGHKLTYKERNPDMPKNAVDPEVAEMALDAALDAKDLDAAVGIVENTYSTKAYTRDKLLRKALIPMTGLGLTPVAAYALAKNYGTWQDSMETVLATNVAFFGMLAYVGFTATMGIVAMTTANDQMKRVTWGPGIPLRERWIREDERAAYDKIACSFGFGEVLRYGEEEGEEFDVLREYILSKGMILDAVNLMPGMQ